MLSLYQILLRLFETLLPFFCKLSPTFFEMVNARQGLLDRWKKANIQKGCIWVHVSSVGELEQIRPSLEKLDKDKVVLSYFSPSVPRLVKDWSFVSYADYLPFDNQKQMQQLLSIVQPKLLVLNRYDLWPNHMREAKKCGARIVVINASTPPLGIVGLIGLHLRKFLFQMVDAWSFVDAVAAQAWEPYLKKNAKGEVLGNPRVDRALQRVESALSQPKHQSIIKLWKRKSFCLVAGSTWPQDEDCVLETWQSLEREKSLVLVPHEPTQEHVAALSALLQKHGLSYVLFSQLKSESNADVLIVDARGILAEIYGEATVAYVGGGFGKQIHSIIEPIAHGVPVAFGPRYHRSPEAATLLAMGPAFSRVEFSGEFSHWIISTVFNAAELSRAKESIRLFIQMHRGAGQRVAEFLKKQSSL